MRGGVSPEVPNDTYQALLALYVFGSRFAAGKRVLDLGCGTGYGSARLASAGVEVVGLDADEGKLSYARKKFPNVRFVQGSAENPPADLGTFGLILAVDLLPHLQSPNLVVEWAVRHLEPEGTFVASVPPIVDERTMEQHKGSGLHRMSLYLWNWESLFRRRFKEVKLFGAFPPDGARLDLSDPSPSRVRAEDFRFDEVSPANPATAGSLSAVLVGSGQTG
ncbi:MAG TPA: class I SAM-dependent methyltransferase [Thermoanaerobaculia bacterium]|nr:class I SAM-dependent methyltransferase [Thermoanaerobaculia bacterium]